MAEKSCEVVEYVQICKMTSQAKCGGGCCWFQSFIATPSLSPAVVQIKQVLIGAGLRRMKAGVDRIQDLMDQPRGSLSEG